VTSISALCTLSKSWGFRRGAFDCSNVLPSRTLVSFLALQVEGDISFPLLQQ
jgi:hypothetical protein